MTGEQFYNSGRSMFAVIPEVTTLLMVAFSLSGCDGGLIGTSTGPSLTNQSTVYLPGKVSPRMPVALLQGTTSPAGASDQPISTDDVTLEPEVARISENWQQIAPYFSRIESTRLALELELLLLDSIFDEVIDYCSEQEESVCVVPAGNLQATYTAQVAERLPMGSWADSQKQNLDRNIMLRLLEANDLLDQGEIVNFGELTFQSLDEPTFAHRIQLKPLALLSGQELQLDWSTDFKNVRYELPSSGQSATGESVIDKYRYQYQPGGQRLIFQGDAAGSNEFLFEVTTGTEDNGDVLFTGLLGGESINGSATDEQAFTTSRDLSGEISTQEVSALEGETVEIISCESDGSGLDVCTVFGSPESAGSTESTISATTHTVSSNADFDLAVQGFGFTELQVLNLPESVTVFDIREDLTGVPLDQLITFCRGWQSMVDDYIELICYADPELAVNGIVVGFDNGGNAYRVDEAMLTLREVM